LCVIGDWQFVDLGGPFSGCSQCRQLDHWAVMPLVPGVAITNSFRDILAGHLISGMARGTEAIFTAAAIGVGIATIFTLVGGIS